MKRIIIFAFLFTTLLWSITASAQMKVGSTSAKFLAMEVGARSTAMGSAFTTITDMGALAVFWNPANMCYVEKLAVSLNYTDWIADIGHSAVGLVYPLGGAHAVGVSLVTLSSGDIPFSTEFEPQTDKSYNFTDLAVGFSYARRFTDRFCVGGTVKFIREKIYDVTATTLAIDVGTLYEVGLRNFKLGASIRNFGANLKYAEKTGLEWPLPMTMRIGVSGEPFETGVGRLVTSFEMFKQRDYREVYVVGLEYWLADYLAVRGGYKLNYDEEEGISAGAGFKLPQGKFKLYVDYAYTSFGVFDSVHRVSLGLGL